MNFPQQPFRPLFLFALVAAAVFALSFTASPAEAPSAVTVTHTSDSELTLLMRDMYNDVAQMKAAVKRRKKAAPALNHERMLSAAASETKKTDSPAYLALAQSYLNALKALQEAAPAQAPALYKNLIDNCMSCHSAFCPGPKMRIQNLYQ